MPDIISYQIKGMHCGSCVSHVSEILSSIPEVKHAHVNLTTEKAVLELFDSGKSVAEEAKAKLQKKGYDLRPIKGQYDHLLQINRDLEREEDTWKYRAMFGAILTLPVLILEMGSHIFGIHTSSSTTAILAIIAAFVLVVSGGSFFRQSIKEFRNLSFSMDSLIAVGSGAAYSYSLINLIVFTAGYSEHLVTHFESACLIVTLICAGRIVEKRQRRDAFSQIVKTIKSIPRTANVIKDNEETSIPIEAISKGDIIIIRAGEVLPLDCKIIEGKTDADFSSITGESVPVLLKKNDSVPAGVSCLNGTIEAEVVRNNNESSVAKMIQQIENAQLDRSKTKQMVDRITGIFVPSVMILSIIVFFAHIALGSAFATAFMAFIAVLVIACPCALGIATPAALLSGSMLLSRHGIFLQDTSAFEKVGKLTDIFFDKTGTLTEARSKIDECLIIDESIKKERIYSIARTLEEGTRHPLGIAINEYAESQGAGSMLAQDIEVIPGDGVTGKILGKEYIIGSKAFVEQYCVNAKDQKQKGTEVWLGIKDKQAIAVFRFKNNVRSESKSLITAIKKKYHLNPWILSGDAQEVVTQVAKAVGIKSSQAKGNLKPDGKSSIISSLQQKDRICAFVGDGINDAPSLSKADLAIAIEEGTEMAKAAAHLKIRGQSIQDITIAIDLLKTIRRKINQNLFFAFAYNAVLIPLAITGFIHPGLAAFAMAGSSITVVANAGLLSRYKLK